MINETPLAALEQFVDKALQPEADYFKIAVYIKPVNNIKIFIDGDKGISIEKCVQFNRRIYKMIEESKLFPEDNFSLEVSSPGVDEPLQNQRQHHKNIGRSIEVFFNDGTKKQGRLIQVTADDIIIEQKSGKNKKTVTGQILISFNNIQKTIVQIQF